MKLYRRGFTRYVTCVIRPCLGGTAVRCAAQGAVKVIDVGHTLFEFVSTFIKHEYHVPNVEPTLRR